MAFINGAWLNYHARDKKISELKERALLYVKAQAAGKLTDEMARKAIALKHEIERLETIHKAENDPALFAYTWLSDESNPDNLDNAIRHLGTKRHDPIEKIAPIHREFFDLCEYIDETPGARVAACSARGHSKSTIFSGVLPLWALLFRKPYAKYTMILSETDTLSKQLVAWIKGQLKHNEKLRKDFGELLYKKSNMNERDNEDSFVTTTGCMVQASSTGKQLRGAKFGSYRPTLVIADDMASVAGNEGTKEAREKLIAWWNSVVMPMPAADGRIVVVGTLTTKDGLLNHILNRKDFHSSYHGAILQGPDHPELWAEYQAIYARIDGTEEADAFYEANKEAMESGIQLAWPWRWTYRDLMHEKHNLGARAFASEYLNKAVSDEEKIFNVASFAYYTPTVANGKRGLLYENTVYYIDDLYITGAWDPSMGATARACLNSFVTVGKHRDSGLIFVLDDMSKREQAHLFVSDVVEKIREYGHDNVSVEGVSAYSEFERQLRDKLRISGLYRTKVNLIKTHKTNKQQRIDSLEPLCHNKTLVFNRAHTNLLDQFDEYEGINAGSLVDTLDALEMAVSSAARPKTRLREKPAWL
ncbi:hypothetical protein [Aneurinibacillus sp. UBA3580]|jgi:hypothetical protein|uniref:hypothetical protein n=1 Tax=Aneurinibacillus sp. UBA3580 TaxID=1946041 RepID=UPI00257C548E|nr:hypothetical protein [Aneurinibacillus sp. UBA3580]